VAGALPFLDKNRQIGPHTSAGPNGLSCSISRCARSAAALVSGAEYPLTWRVGQIRDGAIVVAPWRGTRCRAENRRRRREAWSLSPLCNPRSHITVALRLESAGVGRESRGRHEPVCASSRPAAAPALYSRCRLGLRANAPRRTCPSDRHCRDHDGGVISRRHSTGTWAGLGRPVPREPWRGGQDLALDVHKGQRLPWVDHHRVRPRRARASELAPVDALDRYGRFVRHGQRLPQSSTFSRGSTASGGGSPRPR
jgi:hypothetical protein